MPGRADKGRQCGLFSQDSRGHVGLHLLACPHPSPCSSPCRPPPHPHPHHTTPTHLPHTPPQVVEKTREARQQLEEFRRRQELGSDEDDDEGGGGGKRSTPAALRTRKRRQAKQGERLESAAVENISQLRLACIHPQVGGRRGGTGLAAYSPLARHCLALARALSLCLCMRALTRV